MWSTENRIDAPPPFGLFGAKPRGLFAPLVIVQKSSEPGASIEGGRSRKTISKNSQPKFNSGKTEYSYFRQFPRIGEKTLVPFQIRKNGVPETINDGRPGHHPAGAMGTD
jgi:hypothetical protein